MRRRYKFQHLFLKQEEDGEESASLADALTTLHEKWCQNETDPASKMFLAADVARMVNDRSEYTPDTERQRCLTLREFLFPNLNPVTMSPLTKAVGKRLRRNIGEPVQLAGYTLILRSRRDESAGPNAALSYFVRRSKAV